MASYAIGDIQGCYQTLTLLLSRLPFDPARDRLLLCGDLVNRGPASLEVLRWARGLGERAICVLGNHDLHLLSRSQGIAAPKRRDTLEQVLSAPDREELLAWLRGRPLLHREAGFALFHGGLAPAWSLDEAERLAREAETALRSPDFCNVLKAIETGKPKSWDPTVSGEQRLRDIFHIFTRLRFCRLEGGFNFEFKGPPEQAPPEDVPWFAAPERRADRDTLLFGHWASLGLRLTERFIALDSGCVWKSQLSAVRLEDRKVFQQPYAEPTS